MTPVRGLHHVTALAGDPQATIDFYSGVLGLRLVKRSVNQDEPGTYHLFFADAEGRPGTDLTFFPVAGTPPGRAGAGQAVEVGFALPPGSLAAWRQRLAAVGVATAETRRFGDPTLTFADPHGLALALTESQETLDTVPWRDGPVPEDEQIRGFHAVRLAERHREPVGDFLGTVLGFEPVAEEDGWQRYAVAGGGSGRLVEVAEDDGPRGLMGVGAIHHVAFRVADDAEEAAVRQQVAAAGARPTPVIDRFWFRSVYFREPGGVLFELATDGPGFAVDEDPAALGEHLVLPPWLEPRRAAIEAALPPLRLATRRPG